MMVDIGNRLKYSPYLALVFIQFLPNTTMANRDSTLWVKIKVLVKKLDDVDVSSMKVGLGKVGKVIDNIQFNDTRISGKTRAIGQSNQCVPPTNYL